MISAITPIKPYSPNFTGRKYHKTAKILNDCFCPSGEFRILKKSFNYSTEVNSVEVKPYKGTLEKSAGFSTGEDGCGGGWLVGDIDTPLSTTDVHTCALLNLFNVDTLKQALFHVYHETNANRIEQFIRKIFPDFTHVNIVGGDRFRTVNTMRKISDAVDNVNINAPKTYWHTITENPQLVAQNGEISFVKGKSGQLSFELNTENYWY